MKSFFSLSSNCCIADIYYIILYFFLAYVKYKYKSCPTILFYRSQKQKSLQAFTEGNQETQTPEPGVKSEWLKRCRCGTGAQKVFIYFPSSTHTSPFSPAFHCSPHLSSQGLSLPHQSQMALHCFCFCCVAWLCLLLALAHAGPLTIIHCNYNTVLQPVYMTCSKPRRKCYMLDILDR